MGLRKAVEPLYYAYEEWRKRRELSFLGDRVLMPERAHATLRNWLLEGRPFAAGKLGSLEAEAMDIWMRQASWNGLDEKLYRNVGLFPNETETFTRFCELLASQALPGMDMLAVWFSQGEQEAIGKFAPDATLAEFSVLEPYRDKEPWTQCLGGKRVAVVTPFEQTTLQQWPIRQETWSALPLWPDGCDLVVIRAPFSAGIAPAEDADWFAALDRLSEELIAAGPDVALVGAGGFSLPLCVNAKAAGIAAIHTGGATQLLFGIRGARWRGTDIEDEFWNDHWTDVLPEERPENAQKVERGCYW